MTKYKYVDPKTKYSFIEYVAATESEDFNEIDDGMIEWAKNFLKLDYDQKHEGDCTKQCHTCILCLMEGLLSDYREYYFNNE